MKSIKDRPNECFKHYASGFLVAAAESYVKNCGQKAWACAEQDLLGEALALLRNARDLAAYCRKNHVDIQKCDGIPFEALIDELLAKLPKEGQ